MHGAQTAVLLLQLVAGVFDPAAFEEAKTLLHSGADDLATYQKALAALEPMIAAGDAPAPAYAELAQAYMRVGDNTKGDDNKLALYKKGQAAADAGIAKDARCADCWFWRGATLGRWGQTRGVMQSLFILGDVKEAFQKTLAIQPSNYDAQLSMALIDEKVPGIAGGSMERAEKAMRAVIAAHPTFTRARLDLAELLKDDGRKDEARTLIQGVLDEKAPLHPGEYRKFDQKRAKALLADL